ncbi:unnamed protein product [Didymodactylos carnosus]|uniref:Major facilitator superfamily (MFS) profile domain-containing protein n=1 Tax=Didymodactylos carnosus TaxID=1234261 RepID=A0A814F788_9BILA|nr:unnamed protein product [Didymodactylos carnosus]CAF1158989.1 unnamed protein product [Didymodactylos carnosus]CAF3751744.1 unnamed protein product [Didymodactylos carnosus]CAF3970578.1 unnamed protein product [Didymodactylos carnosus]
MGMLLGQYAGNEEKRGRAVAFSTSAISLGAAVVPLYGGLVYYYLGKPAVFLILAALVLFDGLLRLTVVTSTSNGSKPLLTNTQGNPPSAPSEITKQHASIVTLLQDPYLLLALGPALSGYLLHLISLEG